jgi:XTP/dITP diphosphohydrolase
MPALALATKVLGKAEKIGLLEPGATGPIQVEDEDQLGGLLLAIVTSARASGLDAERALRSAVRDLMADIRKVEILDASDAGVVGRELD